MTIRGIISGIRRIADVPIVSVDGDLLFHRSVGSESTFVSPSLTILSLSDRVYSLSASP